MMLFSIAQGGNNGNQKIQNLEGLSGFSEIHFSLKSNIDTRDLSLHLHKLYKIKQPCQLHSGSIPFRSGFVIHKLNN